MSDQYVTVPLSHDETAMPIGTISYSQFVLSDMSYSAEFKSVRLNDDAGYIRRPMVLTDVPSQVDAG